MAVTAEDTALLTNERFRRLLEARVLGQTAYNALVYALLILVVQETHSSIYSSLLIVAYTLPTVFFGIPAGAIADMIPRRFTLTTGYFLRAIIAAALVYYSKDLAVVYLLAASLSMVGQFFGPAEAATVPALVPREKLPGANSWMTITLILAQVAGMVLIAPLLIKLLGPKAVFVACAGLFLGATYVIAWLAAEFTPSQDRPGPAIGLINSMKEGLDILRHNRHAYLAIVYLTVAGLLAKVLVVLLPRYTEDVLRIKAEDIVFVALPGAIGGAAGLLVAPFLARLIGSWRSAAIGFGLFLLGLIGLGFVVYVRDFIQANLDFGITFVEEQVGVSSVITVTMLLAIPLGFAFTLLAVAGRSVLNEQAPLEAQGRVFAVQMAVGDFLALVPLLVVGAIAELVGVRATLLACAITAAVVVGYLTFSHRFGPPGERRRVSVERPSPAQAG